MRNAILLAVSVCGLAATACRKAPAPAPAPAPAAREDTDTEARERARRDSITRAEAARADSLRADAERRGRAEAAARARRTIEQVVHFDYDEAAIRPDAAAVLDAKAAILAANAAVRLRLTGHTDERGSDEYNLALGQRRAAAVARYLSARGVHESRLLTDSVGEQRPVCTEAGESCWQLNRRATFAITAGGETLTVTDGPRGH
ncbi:MAG: OmpA family protein [Gemmatimonadota bacterium]|nr:OmpA family protein [Gemmatimonadota bacterium]